MSSTLISVLLAASTLCITRSANRRCPQHDHPAKRRRVTRTATGDVLENRNLLAMIMSNLSPQDRSNCKQVNTRWNKAGKDCDKSLSAGARFFNEIMLNRTKILKRIDSMSWNLGREFQTFPNTFHGSRGMLLINRLMGDDAENPYDALSMDRVEQFWKSNAKIYIDSPLKQYPMTEVSLESSKEDLKFVVALYSRSVNPEIPDEPRGETVFDNVADFNRLRSSCEGHVTLTVNMEDLVRSIEDVCSKTFPRVEVPRHPGDKRGYCYWDWSYQESGSDESKHRTVKSSVTPKKRPKYCCGCIIN